MVISTRFQSAQGRSKARTLEYSHFKKAAADIHDSFCLTIR